jgi:hypothetical protein
VAENRLCEGAAPNRFRPPPRRCIPGRDGTIPGRGPPNRRPAAGGENSRDGAMADAWRSRRPAPAFPNACGHATSAPGSRVVRAVDEVDCSRRGRFIRRVAEKYLVGRETCHGRPRETRSLGSRSGAGAQRADAGARWNQEAPVTGLPRDDCVRGRRSPATWQGSRRYAPFRRVRRRRRRRGPPGKATWQANSIARDRTASTKLSDRSSRALLRLRCSTGGGGRSALPASSAEWPRCSWSGETPVTAVPD